jgi:hypothetical protein
MLTRRKSYDHPEAIAKLKANGDKPAPADSKPIRLFLAKVIA